MPDENPAASSTPLRRALDTTAQVLGVLGFLVGVVLAVAALVARGRVVDRLDEVAGRADAGLAKGLPLFAAARERLDGMSASVTAVGAAATAPAGTTAAVDEIRRSLSAKVATVSDRYLGVRASYAEGRERLVAALERLNTLDRMIAAVDVPPGAAEALASLDERVRSLDADLMGLFAAVSDAGPGPVAAAIAEKVEKVEAALRSASAGIGDAGARFDGLRARVAASMDHIRTLVTVAAVALALAFLYVAFLHAVLFRAGRRMRGRAVGG